MKNIRYIDSKLYIFAFLIVNLQYLVSIIFLTQFNLPDGIIHELLFARSISPYLPDNFFEYIKHFDLYNISFYKSLIAQIFPFFDGNCTMKYVTFYSSEILDNCDNKYLQSNSFDGNFGLDTFIYDYSTIYRFSINELALFIYLFFINIILFFLFYLINNKYLFFTFICFILFPSVVQVVSYISPNITTTFAQILFFYLFIKKHFKIYLLVSLIMVIIDNQNIINLLLILVFMIIHSFEYLKILLITNIKLIFYLLLIFLLSNFLIHFNILEILIRNYYPSFIGDFMYMNKVDSGLIRNLFITYLSLYYIGGSMTHLAYALEYIIFLIIILIYIYNALLRKNARSLYNNRYVAYYFILGIFTNVEIMLVFTNVSQGRYFFFLILPVIYHFSHYIIHKNINFYFILFVLFILNNIKILKFVGSGYNF